MEPDSDQSSHIRIDRCLDDVFEFKLVLAVLLVRVWFFVTIWPRNLIGASVMHCVSPSARWNVDWAQSCLCQAPLSHTWKASVSVQVTAA